MTRFIATLREQQAEPAKLDAATCLPKRRRRPVAANLPARRNGSEGGRELAFGGRVDTRVLVKRFLRKHG